MTNSIPIIFSSGDSSLVERNIKSCVESRLEDYRKDLSKRAMEFDALFSYFNALPRNFQAHTDLRSDLTRLIEAWSINEDTLSSVVLNPLEMRVTTGLFPHPNSSQSPYIHRDEEHQPTEISGVDLGETRPSTSYDSIFQLLIHLKRDWCASARHIRVSLYDNGILAAVKKYVPYKDSSSSSAPTVLVPGAGLGRLAVELQDLGLHVHANEVSPLMVTALFNLVRLVRRHAPSPTPQGETGERTNEKGSYPLYPDLNNDLLDEWDLSPRLTPTVFPDYPRGGREAPASAPEGSLSIQLADFVSFYSQPCFVNYFDVVVTSFFVDTGHVLLNVATIAQVLREGACGSIPGRCITTRPRCLMQTAT